MTSYGADNALQKLFYHRGIFSDKIVCYFGKRPQCTVQNTDVAETQKKMVTIFLPTIQTISQDASRTIEKIHTTRPEGYTVVFSQEAFPIAGTKITITYDPKTIQCDYALCQMITLQEGLVLNFHKSDVLNMMKDATDSVLRQVKNNPKKKPRIMLDFGHGGIEEGKVGHFDLKEKDINFQVGMRVAKLLRHKGYHVFLTRDCDKQVALDERTTNANQIPADLFISIHANSGPLHAMGIETYWTERTKLKRTAFSHDLATQIDNIAKNIDQASKALAHQIHQHVLQELSGKYIVHDRFVKGNTVAQVLLGTDMPSALIEIGFLSNKHEALRLSDPAYQQLLARGICAGVESYCMAKKVI